MGKLSSLNKAIKGAKRRVYQGSPHKHNGKLDADKIGTGEGAQAYGYGHYMAESKGVAEGYKKGLSTYETTVNGEPLSKDNPMFSAVMQIAAQGYDAAHTNAKMALDSGFVNKEFGQKALNDIELMKGVDIKQASRGHLYELDLNESAIENMLDWDAPLSEQPKAVQEAFTDFALSPDGRKYAEKFHSYKEGDTLLDIPEFSDWSAVQGDTINNVLGNADNQVTLMKHGVPGIKYSDGMSRGKTGGTQNFVISPGAEDQVKAISRNNELLGFGGAAVLGGAAMAPQDADAAIMEGVAMQGLAADWTNRRADKRSKWTKFKESILEPGLTVGSALTSMPVQGLAGVGALAQGYGINDAVGAMERTGEAMTYAPRSEAGMESLQNVGEAMGILGESPPVRFVEDHINQGADWAADNIHPAAGAALKTLPEVVF